MIGTYNSNKPYLLTDKIAGNIKACMGFVVDSTQNCYVPNALLKEDIRHTVYSYLSEKNIMTKEEFYELNILSEVVSMGYPLGASSTHHEFPLFRKGYLASMPRDFTEDCEGYLDMQAKEGMSVNPIIYKRFITKTCRRTGTVY